MRYLILFGVLSMWLGIVSCNKNKEKEPPNIIFFFTDDQSYDTQKDYGNPNVKTPNLDKLANRGVVFMRHYNITAIFMTSN